MKYKLHNRSGSKNNCLVSHSLIQNMILVPFQEVFFEKDIIVADREMVEQGSDELFEGSTECDVALLVVGDPLGATTHTDLALRAHQLGIPIQVSFCHVMIGFHGEKLLHSSQTSILLNCILYIQVINNASIMTAIGCCGLDLCRFGETVSIPFWLDGWEPTSFVHKINKNLKNDLHTLCLLGRFFVVNNEVRRTLPYCS